MVHPVMMKVSPKQMSKLRNGHKVRVKPPMEGEGVCVIVNPENYSILTRTFSRNKGAEITLSPAEIVANKEASASMEGKGIFGKKFDRAVRKTVGKRAQQNLYGIARELLPAAQAALTAGLTSAGTAVGVAQPELIPFIAPSVMGLSALGSDYLANPSRYQGGKSSTLAKEYAKNLALQKLNEQLGTNMGDLSTAALGKAAADKASAELARYAAEARQQQATPQTGMGLYTAVGNGLYAGATRGGRLHKSAGQVGLNGGFVGGALPPALQSQPYGTNFQFQATLPPAYQRFSRGSGLYA